MKTSLLLVSTSLVALTLLHSSCKKEEDAAPDTSLYGRVGGTTMVTDPKNASAKIEKGRLTLRSVTDSSLLVIAGDTALDEYFPVLFAELGAGNTTGFAALSESFTDFLSVATGSKNSAYAYTGKSMADAHNPAKNSRIAEKIDAADFDKFVGDIGTGLAKNGVTSANNAQLVNDLVALLNTTKSAIVQK